MIVGKNCNIHPTVQIFNGDAIEIGDNTRIDAFCILSGGKGIKIGSHIHIGAGCYFFGGSGIEFEDFVEIAPRCSFHSDCDDWSGKSLVGPQIPDKFKPHLEHGKIILKRHVLIGTNSAILPDVVIGEGAAVGAYSLVVDDVDEWSIYMGIPAVNIKPRSRKMLELEKQFLMEYKP
jgi:dTDP-4-amino-4,6-dideoxy-D-glucose acyltransferase